MAKGHPKKSQCEQRADHRKAQAKYQKDQPKGAQSERNKKSLAKDSTKDPGKTSGIGKNGGKLGRPRKDC